MPDNKYCYPDSEVLKNKLNITDKNELFEAEKELTAIRLTELQDKHYLQKIKPTKVFMKL